MESKVVKSITVELTLSHDEAIILLSMMDESVTGANVSSTLRKYGREDLAIICEESNLDLKLYSQMCDLLKVNELIPEKTSRI